MSHRFYTGFSFIQAEDSCSKLAEAPAILLVRSFRSPLMSLNLGYDGKTNPDGLLILQKGAAQCTANLHAWERNIPFLYKLEILFLKSRFENSPYISAEKLKTCVVIWDIATQVCSICSAFRYI